MRMTYADMVGKIEDAIDGISTVRAQEFVNDGYRMALTGRYPDARGAMRTRQWSFLYPTATLSLSEDDSSAALPDDFGGLVGTFHYGDGKTTLPPVTVVTMDRMRELRQYYATATSNVWALAVGPSAFTDATGQRWTVYCHPDAPEDITLHYTYRIEPIALTGANYPVGNSAFHDAVLAGAFAAREQRENATAGVYTQRFYEAMAAAAEADADMSPRVLGSMRNTLYPDYPEASRRPLPSGVTYNS